MVMQVQAKFTKADFSSACGGGGCVNFMIPRKRLANVREINTLIAFDVDKALKLKNNSK